MEWKCLANGISCGVLFSEWEAVEQIHPQFNLYFTQSTSVCFCYLLNVKYICGAVGWKQSRKTQLSLWNGEKCFTSGHTNRPTKHTRSKTKFHSCGLGNILILQQKWFACRLQKSSFTHYLHHLYLPNPLNKHTQACRDNTRWN